VSKHPRRALLLGTLLVLGLAAPASAATPTPARQAADAAAFDGRFIVVWKQVAPSTLRMSGVASTESSSRPLRSVVTAEPGKATAVARELRADPRVLTVVPDAKLTLSAWPADGDPSDPRFTDQGDLAQIHVPDAWHTTRGAGVVVAVIDSGVDLTHPDLDGVTVVDPRNEVWNSTDVTDEVGHGTHVAGTIVAETNNGVGISGIAPDASLMPIKVADDDGFVALSDVLDGVDWAREHGADVVNMSLGGQLSAEEIALAQPVFTAARNAGVLMVAASGNDGIPFREYPASFRGVVSVGAVDGTDTIAPFSDTGRALDLVAPGVDLVSTVPGGGYEVDSGTSMASPHVAGVAALVLAARPGLAVDELEAVLRASAVDLGDPGHDSTYADGRVDAEAALEAPVPDPIPDLEPPAPLPDLTIDFLAPTSRVVQTATSYTVKLAISHDVAASVALRASWAQVNGHCPVDRQPRVHELPFGPTIELTGLKTGRCYQVLVAAIDEDGNYAEALSAKIKILDLVPPRIVHRAPAAGSDHVARSSNVRIGFSEPVVVRRADVRLRNVHTGAVVAARLTWDARTNTAVLDPLGRLAAHARYRVEVGAGVTDRGGNHLVPRHWGFTTDG
jgi:subtilisin family serine protease